jgi:hypothetical protein
VKRYIALLFALLVLVSCSEADPGAPSSAPPSNGATEDAPAGDDRKQKQGPGKPSNDKDQDEGEKGADETPRRRALPSEDDDGSDEDAADSSSPFNDSGGEDDNSSAVYPAAGSYLYSQSGFEKFCSGGSCERQALPERQTARIILQSRTDGRAVVVTETSSGDRMLRTTATFTRANSLITDVYTRLSYRGFAFENEYHPAPPVESLRFPLRDGARWSGSWEDSTSGDYSVQVFGPSRVTVNGRAVRAFQVATTTRFEGEFEGEAKTLTWVDPATKAIVKLSGAVDLTSTYGRYVTEFSSSLRSGPRY